jgi:hypothetical protein
MRMMQFVCGPFQERHEKLGNNPKKIWTNHKTLHKFLKELLGFYRCGQNQPR